MSAPPDNQSASSDSSPDRTTIASNHERLLAFLYRTPVGIIEIAGSGDILLINAHASQLLMPLATRSMLDNLFEVLDPWTGEVKVLVNSFERERGIVCSNQRVHVDGAHDPAGRPVFLSFTIHKMDTDRFLVSFFDDSERVAQEVAIAEAIEIQAHQAGRIELASTIMHDIGNAMTGLGIIIGKLAQEPAWPEAQALAQLAALFEGRKSQLATALGDGKAEALVDYVQALIDTLSQREARWREHADRLAASIYHVQEILTVQRQITRFGSAGARQPVVLSELVHDALTITNSAFEKRGIHIHVELDRNLPRLSADSTRLVQVLVNLLKNCADSFDQDEAPARGRKVEVRAHAATPASLLTLTVSDNGAGFASAQSEHLLERGTTLKPEGAGIGLYASRKTIEAHGGTLRIDSPGPSQGATVTIELPFQTTQPTALET